jgi:hypothetical protein
MRICYYATRRVRACAVPDVNHGVILSVSSWRQAMITNVVANFIYSRDIAAEPTIGLTNSVGKKIVIYNSKVAVQSVGRKLKPFVNTETERFQVGLVHRRVVEVPAYCGSVIHNRITYCDNDTSANEQGSLSRVPRTGWNAIEA